MAWGASLPFHLSQFPGDSIMPEQDCAHGAQGAFDEWFGFDAAKVNLEAAQSKVASSDTGAMSRAHRRSVNAYRSAIRRPFFAWLRACPVPRSDLAAIPSFLIGACPRSAEGPVVAAVGRSDRAAICREADAWRMKRDRKRLWEMFFVTCLQRIGYVVFHDPATGVVSELKRPRWLMDEDKA
jgi:hypothetical protein